MIEFFYSLGTLLTSLLDGFNSFLNMAVPTELTSWLGLGTSSLTLWEFLLTPNFWLAFVGIMIVVRVAAWVIPG